MSGRMTPETAAKIRLKELAKIHLAKKQLGWSEDEYRAAISSVSKCKTTSAGELDFKGRFALLKHMEKCGFKLQPQRKKTPVIPMDDSRQGKLARHLWLELDNAGALRDPSENALRKYVKRVTGKDALQFCNDKQMHTVIESLKQWNARLKNKGAGHGG